MREQRASSSRVTQSILPALKTYAANSVAIIGCHSLKWSRSSCEYDLLIVGEAFLAPKSIRVKDLYVDLLFADEKEVKDAADPEFAVMLSSLMPIRDNQWVLATAVSESKKSFHENCMQASKNRLGSSLKALARVEENLSQGSLQDADFWLLSAGYDFSLATLYAAGTIPSPSHLLTQMKKVSKEPQAKFKEWAESIGLPLAARTTSENRLGGLSVLYDILRTVEFDSSLSRTLGRYQSKEAEEIMKRKSRYLMDILLSTESYAYLGYEVVQTMINLLQYQAVRLGTDPNYQSVVGSLSKGRNRIISEQVVLSLGLVRSKEMLVAESQALRDSISKQARSI